MISPAKTRRRFKAQPKAEAAWFQDRGQEAMIRSVESCTGVGR